MEETIFSVDVYTSFDWPYTWHYIINYYVAVDRQISSTRAVIHGVKIKLHDTKWINQSFCCNKADLDIIIKLVNRANKICKLCALKNENEMDSCSKISS